ncbi:MAG: hypothetical protein GEV07_10650 [Streptosporangiales bacterium]|nr:hypothetical protein [Streptosporangiales bacterium]
MGKNMTDTIRPKVRQPSVQPLRASQLAQRRTKQAVRVMQGKSPKPWTRWSAGMTLGIGLLLGFVLGRYIVRMSDRSADAE